MWVLPKPAAWRPYAFIAREGVSAGRCGAEAVLRAVCRAGAAEACGLLPQAPLAQAGWGVGRTSPGGWFGRVGLARGAVRPGSL